MKYCKSCGHSLTVGAKFCNKCGTSLSERPLKEEPSDSMKIKERWSLIALTKKQKVWGFSIFASLVILLGGSIIAQTLLSKERLVKKFETALVDNDAATVAKLLTTDDKKATINKTSVQGFMKYFKKHPDERAALISALKTQSASEDNAVFRQYTLDGNIIKLQEDGKFLFFDKYTLVAPTIYLTLSTNYKNTNLYIDGKKVGKSTKENESTTFGPYLPGIYEVKADLETDFVNLVKQEEVSLFTADNNYEIEIFLDGEDITFYFGLEDEQPKLNGTLFINGKDVKINPFKHPTVGPLILDGSMKAAVKAELPWGTIKTDEIQLDHPEMQLNLGYNQEFQQQMMDLTVGFTDEYLSAITTGNTDILTNASSSFVSETKAIIQSRAENNQHYKGKHLSSTFDLDSFSLSFIDGIWTLHVDILEKYNEDNYYAEETPSLEDTEYEYTYVFIYEESSKKWVVDKIEGSWSFDEENTKEIVNETPTIYTTNIQGMKSTVAAASYSQDEIEDFMNDYISAYVTAINENDFSIVQNYLTTSGKSYGENRDYINYINSKGISEDLLDVTVTNVEPTEDGYRVFTEEQYKIHQSNGSSSDKSYQSEYLLKLDDAILKADTLVETKEIKK